jgi:hypothetical protein
MASEILEKANFCNINFEVHRNIKPQTRFWILQFRDYVSSPAYHALLNLPLNVCVITEISSAQGDKNSTSSTQDWSHSWHRINPSSLQKGQKLYK